MEAQHTVEQVVIRFAGDSGDGMQLLGSQFTHASALAGNDLATLPDYPAEIRAPAGTPEGVSGFQLQFANYDIFTPGDQSDVLVVMNVAALISNLNALRPGGIIIANKDKFKAMDLKKARLEVSPLEDDSLSDYRVFEVPISTMTKDCVAQHGLNAKQADRCKNFFALGMMYWMYSRTMDNTKSWVSNKFSSPYKEANIAALEAGYSFAETAGIFQNPYVVEAATDLPEGMYRNITGNTALAIGLVAAAQKADKKVFYGTYPITPASDVLHSLAPFKNYGVVTFQAEDEIAGVAAAIGASYGGAIGVTGTSGPGLALKGEAIGLAMITELPLVIVNVQRGGPSTGLPTKTEQSDLLQAMYGRNGESPVAVIAAQTPSDCFDTAFEAVRIALTYMVPVILLSDGYVANGAEPWLMPDFDALPTIDSPDLPDTDSFLPYMRNAETLARPWAIPGKAGYEHRIGGLEKEDLTGNVSYDPENHQKMCEIRAEKILRIQRTLPPLEIHGDDTGLLVLGWGSTFGAIRTAVNQARTEGTKVAHVHLRHLNPLNADLEEVMSRYSQVLLPEMNLGQLSVLIRDRFLIDVQGLNKIQGQPFRVSEIKNKIDELVQSHN